MKRIQMLGIALLLAVLAVPTARAQSGADLFQQGLKKERVDGDLKGAIAVYERVVKDYAKDHSLAARALVQLGESYEKLGSIEARAAYQRIVRDFADQSEQVAIARARLTAFADKARATAGSEAIVRRVWAGADVDPDGAQTRDGRYLTFVDWLTGDLAVHDITTGENRHLTNKGTWRESIAFALYSVPSPDSRRVAYVWGDVHNVFDLRLVGIDGSDSRVLYRNPELEMIRPHDWSPDGTQILVLLSGKPRTNQIALVSAADGSVRVLKTLDWGKSPSKMCFSPDGKYIAYDFPSREDAPERDIFILAADGSRESVLVKHPADDFVLGWAPDGKNVLFASDRTGPLSVWAAPVKDGEPAGEPKLIRSDLGSGLTAMGFTADGSFYYAVNASHADIYVASLDPMTGKTSAAPAKMVEHFVGANSRAAWSRDGASLVYQSVRSPVPNAPPLLVIRSMATGAERTISTKLTNLGDPYWSPDGRSIVARARDETGRDGVYRIDAQTGEVTAAVAGNEGGCAHYFAGFSSDGESIVCLDQDFARQSFGVVLRNLKSGQTRDLYRATVGNIYPVVVSNDGRQAAFVRFFKESPGSLQVLSTTGGEPREVYRFAKGESTSSLGWSADGRYLFFTKVREDASMEEQQMPIWRLPVTGGAPEETGLTMDLIRDIRSHPDGQRISFTSGRGSAEVWVMENFLPKAESRTPPKLR